MSQSKKDPPGNVLNKDHMANILNITPQTLLSYVNAKGCPYIERGRRGVEWKFNRRDVVDWYTNNVKHKGDESLDEARLRKMRAEATLSEIEVEKIKGTLVEVEQVKKVVGKQLIIVRNKLLTVPDKCAPKVLILDDIQEIKLCILESINEVLQELSE